MGIYGIPMAFVCQRSSARELCTAAVIDREQHGVGEVGLEPTRPCEHGLLRPACLPISALAQAAEEREGFEPSKGLLL